MPKPYALTDPTKSPLEPRRGHLEL